jgi:S-adenosylmethionine synthetase
MKIDKLKKSRQSIVEALLACQTINSVPVDEAKAYLYKAIKNIDIAIGKQSVKLEAQQERKEKYWENTIAKHSQQAKQAQATTSSIWALQELNKLIEEKERQLLELEAKKQNKRSTPNNGPDGLLHS